jgi:hypothetical protein
MRRCPPGIPWHRVLNAGGGISPRARMSGMLTQRLRLIEEGIRLRGDRVSLARYAWGPARARAGGRAGRTTRAAASRPGRPGARAIPRPAPPPDP